MSDQNPTPAGWYHDPFGQGDGRYWNGIQWTDANSRGGVTLNLPPDPTQATIPPVPGTELRAPVPATATPPPAPPQRSAAPIIIGLLLVVAVAIGLFFLLTNDSGDDTPTTPTTTANTPATVTPVTPSVTTPPVTVPPVTEPTPTTVAP